MGERSVRLGRMQDKLNLLEASQRSVTNLVILLFSFLMLFLMIGLRQSGSVDLTGMVVGTVAMMGSFGPVTALASLSNNLNQTLASGERVLSILEEKPVTEEVKGNGEVEFADAEADGVDFSYEDEQILKDYSIKIPKGKVTGINTSDLREMESYVTQETCLFHDSIANNIAVAKPGRPGKRSWRRRKKRLSMTLS